MMNHEIGNGNPEFSSRDVPALAESDSGSLNRITSVEIPDSPEHDGDRQPQSSQKDESNVDSFDDAVVPAESIVISPERDEVAALWEDGPNDSADSHGQTTNRGRETGDDPRVADFSPDQRAVHESRKDIPGASHFLGVGDSLERAAQNIPVDPDRYSFLIHGNPDCVGVQSGDDLHVVDADEFADVIRQSPWDGQPITLNACSVGEYDDGFAQQLSNNLGVEVTAPDAPLWLAHDGSSFVSDMVEDDDGNMTWTWPPNGGWRTFYPEQEGADE